MQALASLLHSGAPLVDWSSGMLIGLLSSWDDETGMRRGVQWEAIETFSRSHGELFVLHFQTSNSLKTRTN